MPHGFVPANDVRLGKPATAGNPFRRYDLGTFATKPLDQALIRRLLVLKLWQAGDSFDPARLMRKFQDGRGFDWDDLVQLVRRTTVIDRDRITADCARGFAFLADLTDEERVLAGDPYQRERELWERLSRGLN